MTEQEKAIYDIYDALFLTEGWGQFITDLEDSKEEIGNIDSIKDAKELYVLQGKRSMVDTILNMQHMMELAKEQAEGDEYETSI